MSRKKISKKRKIGCLNMSNNRRSGGLICESYLFGNFDISICPYPTSGENLKSKSPSYRVEITQSLDDRDKVVGFYFDKFANADAFYSYVRTIIPFLSDIDWKVNEYPEGE